MAATIPAVSREYLKAPINASVTLDSQPVEVCFLPKTQPSPDDATVWYEAEWTGAAATTRVWRILLGPTAPVVLAAGSYNVWSRITDTTEEPVRLHDVLTII